MTIHKCTSTGSFFLPLSLSLSKFWQPFHLDKKFGIENIYCFSYVTTVTKYIQYMLTLSLVGHYKYRPSVKTMSFTKITEYILFFNYHFFSSSKSKRYLQIICYTFLFYRLFEHRICINKCYSNIFHECTHMY